VRRGDDPRFEREYFERSYRSYRLQNPPRKLAFYRGLVEKAAARHRRPRILEIGCAFGDFLAALDGRWVRSGLDASEYAIGEARRRVPEAAFAVGNSVELPFAGPFDVVAAFDVLEHVPELEPLRREIWSKLSARGTLVFVVPVYDGPTGPLIRRLDRDPTHLHKHSRQFWLEWVASGFRIVEWWGVYRYLLPGGAYVHWPTKVLRHWTPAVAVVAEREGSGAAQDPCSGSRQV
jgi:SAM-dependent methyltransferase